MAANIFNAQTNGQDECNMHIMVNDKQNAHRTNRVVGEKVEKKEKKSSIELATIASIEIIVCFFFA